VVTFVLLALFGPELLDGSGRVYTAEIIDIPEPPELPTPPLLKPPSPLGTGFQSESSDHNVTSVKPKAQLSELKIKEAAKTPEKVDTASKSSTTLPKKATSLATRKPAWTLQLATFSQPKNAYALRERLTKDGFNSYSRLIKDSSGSTRYQVYVGPEISKEKMLIVKKQLAKKLKLKDGIIKPYVP
jgi:cell division septation protein DedD